MNFPFKLYKEDREILTKIKAKCERDLRIWNLANLLFPIVTILISLLFFFFSTKNPFNIRDREDAIKSFFDFLLNGSIPLIGINLIVGCSFFLIKFNKDKERKLGLSTSNLRLTLIVYSLLSYLFLSSLFAIQAINVPFESLTKQIILFILSLFGVYISIQVANKLFLLQEEYVDMGFDEGISQAVGNLKNAIE